VHAADLPYRMPTGEVLDEVTPRETLEHGLKTFDVEAFRRRQQAERAQGVYRGLERASPFICVKAAASPS
jgi:carbon-monoxide dehydrogenase large subunit